MGRWKSIDMTKLKFDDRGLIPVVAQDANDGVVLMVAYMNKESLQLTIDTGVATYWSRSRQKLWKKGESSGNIQNVADILTDCDGDTLVIKIEQVGDAACHTGRRSCFFNRATSEGSWDIISDPLKDPKEMYKK